jgi:L-fucose isomerase
VTVYTADKEELRMKRKVGILTFSDGRKYIHDDLLEVNQRYQKRLAQALEATGEVDVVVGEEIIWTSELAQREGRRLAAEGVELTIFNYAIWAFPTSPRSPPGLPRDRICCSAT